MAFHGRSGLRLKMLPQSMKTLLGRTMGKNFDMLHLIWDKFLRFFVLPSENSFCYGERPLEH